MKVKLVVAIALIAAGLVVVMYYDPIINRPGNSANFTSGFPGGNQSSTGPQMITSNGTLTSPQRASGGFSSTADYATYGGIAMMLAGLALVGVEAAAVSGHRGETPAVA